MSYRTCTLKSLYEAIVRDRALDPDTASVSATQKGQIAEDINEVLKQGWEEECWPELMEFERRQYRATWDDTVNYATDDEVYHVDADGNEKYWVSLQDGNVGYDPDTETAWWAEVGEDFLRTISFQQDGETEIGAVEAEDCIYDNDPRVTPGLVPLEDVEAWQNSILVRTEDAPTRPWVRFRPVCPEFSLTEWSADTYYGIGDLVYLSTSGATTVGECFKALTANNGKDPYVETADWEQVNFPKFLKEYVRYGVAALLAREDEGRFKATAQADEILNRLVTREIENQVPRQRRAAFRPMR